MTIDKTGRQRLVSFGLIGVANTAIDITIFLGLRQLLVPILLANIISTSAALGFSYVMNKRFTFNSSKHVAQSLPAFILVTLAGLWILQPIIISLVLLLLNVPAVESIANSLLANADKYYELFAKLAATPATLVWNFLLYKKVAFRDGPDATLNKN